MLCPKGLICIFVASWERDTWTFSAHLSAPESENTDLEATPRLKGGYHFSHLTKVTGPAAVRFNFNSIIWQLNATFQTTFLVGRYEETRVETLSKTFPTKLRHGIPNGFLTVCRVPA
ncbi:hypothetical protein DSO57_1013135 [Entomophthora muscae]|uniref:Uncharacterized protein n=1 Tax=Entomophthora muscae TaxID=34485 RepID=A0ACC2SUY7_9FUNG|nr:hypothetical protein DSO57_1013135 [Entomophthora muscae]